MRDVVERRPRYRSQRIKPEQKAELDHNKCLDCGIDKTILWGGDWRWGAAVEQRQVT